MIAYDFEYDGIRLSDRGLIICNFDSKGLETISNGSEITFNTIGVQGGTKYNLTSTKYENCLETTIQICKTSCVSDMLAITDTEFRELTRWLSRKKFLKFKILADGYMDLYFEASFNISRIEINGLLYGLELQVVTNRPFALKEPKTIVIKNTVENGEYGFKDDSHEEGYIYPYTKIIIKEDGDLIIANNIENRETIIDNCTEGEVITMDYPVITSSNPEHELQNDFNWNFFRVANTFNNNRNDLTISIPCEIKFTYSPIVKVGL